MWRSGPEPAAGSDADLLAAIAQQRLDALRLLHQRHAAHAGWLAAIPVTLAALAMAHRDTRSSLLHSGRSPHA